MPSGNTLSVDLDLITLLGFEVAFFSCRRDFLPTKQAYLSGRPFSSRILVSSLSQVTKLGQTSNEFQELTGREVRSCPHLSLYTQQPCMTIFLGLPPIHPYFVISRQRVCASQRSQITCLTSPPTGSVLFDGEGVWDDLRVVWEDVEKKSNHQSAVGPEGFAEI